MWSDDNWPIVEGSYLPEVLSAPGKAVMARIGDGVVFQYAEQAYLVALLGALSSSQDDSVSGEDSQAAGEPRKQVMAEPIPTLGSKFSTHLVLERALQEMCQVGGR